jgi:hypothetical protein
MALPEGIQKKAYPEMAKGALSSVPFVITLWPPFLMGLFALSRRKEEVSREEGAPTGDESSRQEDRHV